MDFLPQSTAYGWLMLLAIVGSLVFWTRLVRRDDRLIVVFIAALAGAFLGAKVIYFAAEGWLHVHDGNFWAQLAAGKSILGGLLGGYLSVEVAKRLTGYRGITGDWFATIVPLAVALGRVGCATHGCCLGRVCEASWFTVADAAGVARWPAAQMELGFNLAAAAALFALRRAGKLPGQHFHIYLIAYGSFRFVHEFERATPAVLGWVSGYQFAALVMVALGVVRFRQRSREPQGPMVRVIPPEEPGVAR